MVINILFHVARNFDNWLITFVTLQNPERHSRGLLYVDAEGLQRHKIDDYDMTASVQNFGGKAVFSCNNMVLWFLWFIVVTILYSNIAEQILLFFLKFYCNISQSNWFWFMVYGLFCSCYLFINIIIIIIIKNVSDSLPLFNTQGKKKNNKKR